ncbi:MAG: hypothetical protein FJ087_21795 [Deltaproteobacteria bacterium]|nr:hypothetical protein [Deltaproteobacteria bacterium]
MEWRVAEAGDKGGKGIAGSAGRDGRRGRAVLGTTIAAILFAAVGEAGIRATGIDWRLLGALLYVNHADPEVHEPDEGPLLYRLKPGARAEYGERKVTVNALGFRDPERIAAKPDGVRRIVVLGASNTYGAAVSDGDTYPAQLERRLNAAGGDVRWEVWNAGVSAYTLRQMMESARRVLPAYRPDLVILQHNNMGRRPFLRGDDPRRHFEREPELWWQNVRIFPLGRTAGTRLFELSALWRAVVLGLNHLAGADPNPGKDDDDALNDEPFVAFCGDGGFGGVPVVLLHPHRKLVDRMRSKGMQPLSIWLHEHLPPGAGPEYKEIHPPAHVYAWYAEVIQRELFRMGLL